MRTKVEQDFLDKLENYILTMGKMIDFSEQSFIVSKYFAKYLICQFLEKLTRHEIVEIWLNDIFALSSQLNLHDGTDTVLEFIQTELINRYFVFTLTTICSFKDISK